MKWRGESHPATKPSFNTKILLQAQIGNVQRDVLDCKLEKNSLEEGVVQTLRTSTEGQLIQATIFKANNG